MTADRSRWVVAAGVVLGCLLPGEEAAIGATGDLSSPACLSGDSATSARCAQAPGAFATGVSSGLDGIQSADVSPDGESIYATSQQDDAIVELDRDPATNAISFGECITGESNSAVSSCSPGPVTASAGADTGFDGIADAAVSPDGEWVYALAQNDDAVIRFDRDAATGALSFVDCISAETATVTGPCDASAIATSANGASTGLDYPNGIAIAERPSGLNLYVTSQNDAAVTRFFHDTGAGTFTAVDCISAETESGSAGSSACADAPTVSSGAVDTGLGQPFSPAVSPDGDNLYVTSNADATVAWFDRGPLGGLTWNDCVTGKRAVGPGSSGNGACSIEVPSATLTTGGANSGLERAQTLVIPENGEQLYAGSQTDAAVYFFARNAASGDLAIHGCLTGEEQISPSDCSRIPTSTTFGSESGLEFLQSLALSPDGKSLYAAAAGDAAIATFDRELSQGEIAWDSCVTGEAESGPAGSGACTAPAATAGGTASGLNAIRSLAVTPDGQQLLGGADADDSIVSATRAIAPETTLISGPLALSNDTMPWFTFIADENPVTFQCRVDGDPFGPCSGVSMHRTGVLDGPHTFRVRAVNDVSVPDPTPASWTFTVDSTPPITTISSGPDGPVAATSAEFAFSAAGASRFICRIDGGGFSACTSPKEYSGLAEGSHTFEVRAIDAASNIETPPASRAFAVDKTAPLTSLDKGPKRKVETKEKKKSAKFRFSADEPDVEFECKRDKGKDFKPCTSPYKKKYKHGKHAFKVRATDAAGNVGAAVEHTWKVKRRK